MKLPFTCPQCDQENRENGNFIPSIEQRDVIITNQITYEYTCSKGHQCFCVLQIERFEMLYKLAVNDTLRMYKNDDIRMYNFDCITDTIVEVITTCNTYTILTVHLL